MQSWAKNPTDRPTFAQVFEELLCFVLPQLKFTVAYEEEGKLTAAAGDVILVIKGR